MHQVREIVRKYNFKECMEFKNSIFIWIKFFEKVKDPQAHKWKKIKVKSIYLRIVINVFEGKKGF